MDLTTRHQVRHVLTDPRRLGPLLLAFAGYAFAGVTVPLLLLFAGGWWLPKTVDTGPHLATAPSVLIDVLLLALFGLQHSGMARPSFKAFITKWVPEALERTLYIVMASLAVWVLCLGWQPLPQRIWSMDGVVGTVLDGGFWLGVALVYAATLLLNHFYLLGLSQAYRAYVTRLPGATCDRLQVNGPYRLVRHPLMTGLLICFWCASTFTFGHLLWAAGLTGYILLGTFLEERDLIARFGAAYRTYAARVPAFFPSPLKDADKGAARMNQPQPVATIENDKNLETTVAIIGSGFSGLGMAIQLRKRGRDDFLILEKSHDIGGTWRDNTYPGCGCDVPTAIYSYSFEQNPYWSKMWASQPEIQAYLQRITDKYDLRRKVAFDAELVEAHWDDVATRWRGRLADGRTVSAQFLVISASPLHVPRIPELSGIESFTGPAFHSARWDHSVDLTGKKVAVIGTGASAIQFVPIIAEHVEQLQVYQRSPAWILARPNPTMPKLVQKLFAKVALSRKVFRYINYWIAEFLGIAVNGYGNLHKVLQWAGEVNIRKSIKDPALVAKLTPEYQVGCKRLLFSRTYYPALARPNVEVITDGIAQVRPGSIVTVDGAEREVDVIIYATGFQVVDDRFDRPDIRGVGGELMWQRWNTDGAQGHMGVAMAGMPNIFLLMGPNTGVAYTSIVFMIEQQIKYVLRAMDGMQQRGADSIQVRQDAQDRFNEDIQRRSAKRVWTNGSCTNWFVDAKGVNRALWPGFTWQYWRAARNFDETEYEFTRADHPPTIGCAGHIGTDGQQRAPGAHLVPGSTSLPRQRVGSA